MTETKLYQDTMLENIFEGELVRLVMVDYETIAECFHRWHQDSEFMRLLDMGPSPAFSTKKIKEWVEKEIAEPEPSNVFFMIQDKSSQQLIGDIGLDGIRWNHGDCFVGIGIGERELWGKGYGTEAMRLIVNYAFSELNLHRVSLNVFDYNPRALRSYEKVGFKIEGRQRKALNRDGKRWDAIFMGILRSDWEKLGGEQ